MRMKMYTGYNLHNKKIYQYRYRLVNSNMFIMVGNKSAVVIDAVISEEAVTLLQDSGVEKLWILITHEHYDHIQGINYLRSKFDCCIMGNAYAIKAIEDPKKNLAAYLESLTVFKKLQNDWREEYQIPDDYACKGDVGFESRDVFEWEEISFHIQSTPGHSKGSVCISVDDCFYFTGDSLVDGEDIILRLPGGSKKDYIAETKPYLEQIKKDSIILPGHGEIRRMEAFRII